MTLRQCKQIAQDEHNSWSAEQATVWTHYSKQLRMIIVIDTMDHAKLPAKYLPKWKFSTQTQMQMQK